MFAKKSGNIESTTHLTIKLTSYCWPAADAMMLPCPIDCSCAMVKGAAVAAAGAEPKIFFPLFFPLAAS